MIRNCIKNICLITFALMGPISLPAGGIQKNLNDHSLFESSEEITLNTELFIYCCPAMQSMKLRRINAGESVSVLKYWQVSDSETWIRVKVSDNFLTDNSKIASRGWLKI